jgi:peptidoglycan/xylan/chitin deacetylase (PgdA/CDA1 family)
MPTSIPFRLTANQIKRAGAKVFDWIGINGLGFRVQKAFFSPFIRAINYHVVEEEHARSFEEHLRYYSRAFVSVDRDRLESFLTTGEWQHPRPGLILSFDDGHSTHHDVVAPLLEKYGFIGWFFIPAGLMNLPENLADREIECESALTLKQLKHLNERHIVGSHSETHCRLGKDVSAERLVSEISGSKLHLEQALGHPIDIFCWVGGEEASYSRKAAELIKSNYKYSFMTNNAVIRAGSDRFQLQRTNIEAENPMSLVRFQLSGIMDLVYTNKRRRVNKLTG